MSYYNGKKNAYTIDGVEIRYLTEEQAEKLAEDGYDVEAEPQGRGRTLPDGAADAYLYCSCPDDLPDGRTRELCPHCKLLVEEDIPFTQGSKIA
jgi:hypothetical protein